MQTNLPPMSPTPQVKTPRVSNISLRLQNAMSKGMVLDVSAMNPITGIGARTIKLPSKKSGKLGVIGLDIISSNPDTYVAAIRMLEQITGMNYQQFIYRYNQLYTERQLLKQPQQPSVTIQSPLRLVAATVSKPTASKVHSIISRLQEATIKGKVLDVSKMEIDTGRGIKSIKLPGPKSKKIGVVGLNIISNNIDAYIAAIHMLERETGQNYGEYINIYQNEYSRLV